MNAKIKAKIEMNSAVITALEAAKAKALELTADWILSDIIAAQVVPFDTGALQSSGWTEVHKEAKELVACIIFNTPYARRWYFNVPNENGRKAQFQTSHNPNAQDHWMDYYLDGEGKKRVIEQYIFFFKQAAGGIIQ